MNDPSTTSPTSNLSANLPISDPAEAAIVRELELRREEHGCRYFEPNGAQDNFLKLFGDPSLYVGIFSAANGIGKTATIANVLANIIWGRQNRFFDYPLFREWPYPKRIRFITDPKLVEEGGPFHTEVKRWWPRGRYEASKGGKTYFSHYRANGFYIDVMSSEQAVKEFEGHTLGAVLFDEPPVRSIWNASVARLRMGGLALVFMTPLTEAGWFFDEVVPRHSQHVVYGDIEENCKQHGIRGQLEHSNIERMIAEMDPDEVEARAHGKAMYLRGLIWKTFDPRVHVAKGPIAVPSNADVWQIVDPAGLGKPFAVGYGFPDSDGTLYQFAEWPSEDFYRMPEPAMGVKDYAALFRRLEQGWNVRKRILDRHFGVVRNLYTKRTLFEEFDAEGIHFEPSYTGGQNEEEVEAGILKVREYLAYNPSKDIDGINKPHYIVSPECKNTIKAFQRWSRDPKTMKPQEAYKDFADVVRYWAMGNPQVSYSPPMQEPRRLFA